MNHRPSVLSAAVTVVLTLAVRALAQDEKPPDPPDITDGMP
jgi:hypothetical protein